MKILKVLNIFILIWSSILVAKMPNSSELSYHEVIEWALENSPTLVQIQSDRSISELEFENSKSVFYPQLDLTATHGLHGSNPSIYKSLLASDLSLELSENIYDNGLSFIKYRKSSLNKELQSLNYDNERDKVILAISSEFMQFSLAKNLLEAQKQQYLIIRKQYESVSGQYKLGVKTHRDFLRFKTELRRSEIEVKNAETRLEKSRLDLMRLIGFNLNETGKIFNFIPLEIDLKSVQEIPSQEPQILNHYEFRMAEIQRKILDEELSQVGKESGPELSFNAKATYQASDYLDTNGFQNPNELRTWSALLTLKFNLLDWGFRKRTLSIGQSRKIHDESLIHQKLNFFTSENSKMMLDLKQSSNNFSLARELLNLENSNYEFLNSEYKNGKGSYLNIIVGLRDLLNAKVQMNTSYFDLKGQLLKYHYHEGNLYEFISKK